jgi:hypothetical protein
VVARYQRNHLLAWSDECLPDSPTAVARREEYAKKKPDAGRRDFGWDEKDHPRNEDGEFATKGERQSPEKNRENGPRTGLEKTMDTNKYHELGRAFAEKHGFVGKKDAARDLRAHGIEPTEATVTAWRRGAEPVADERREAERRRRLEFVETFVAEYVAELRAEHPDWTDDEIVEAAEPAAWEEHDRRREEELAESKARVWNRATDRLWAAGLVCCGVSAVSRSRYYGRDERADGRERIRLSDHSVAHACSDCAVCVEIGAGSPDADVVIGETADDAEIDEAISRAVELFGRRCPEEEEEAV